ncbi:MAG: flagellar export chaperone FlgN [Solirubrobacteraceae bacterium]
MSLAALPSARLPAGPAGDPQLSAEVLAHLDTQLASARVLLAIVLEQGQAIRRRAVQEVVNLAGRMQAELERRRQIDAARTLLLERAGARLRIGSGAVTLEALTSLMTAAAATAARAASAELRGLLDEIQREHIVNRALMTHELAFLDHLLRLVDLDGPGAYGDAATKPSRRSAATVGARRVLDMQA